jgi:uncharacterized protein YndB with AHSA1/START domain
MAAAKSLVKKEAGEREDTLVLERIFDAPRDLVFEAWTKPEHLKRWFGPIDYPLSVIEQDARVGGGYTATLRSIHVGPDLAQRGVYKEIIKNEKIVFSFAWTREHAAGTHEMVVSIVFSDVGSGKAKKTKMSFTQTLLPSIAQRDGHRYGWTSTFDRLDAHLRALLRGLGAEARDTKRRTNFAYPADEPIMIAERTFDAPRELVFEAMTKAEHMAKWWGPARYKSVVHEFDARPGGKWRITHSGEDGDCTFFGDILEVTPPSKFVWTFAFADYPPCTETMTLTDLGDGTTRVTNRSVYPTMEARNGMLETDMEEGASETYDRLDALLETMKARA